LRDAQCRGRQHPNAHHEPLGFTVEESGNTGSSTSSNPAGERVAVSRTRRRVPKISVLGMTMKWNTGG
jgi:hypothetical protein